MAIYHVDYNNGSNANDGSAANPYATIKYALQTHSLGNGDTVKVRGTGETTVDSAATRTGTADPNKLTTSTDLTTLISVGDIVRVDPPSPTEFQGWATVRVTAIDATSITFYEEILLPGTLQSGNWTIKTFDSAGVVTSTASTFETWNTGDGYFVDIIGGYDATFANIIGRTYFRKDVGAGSSSGTCFSTGTNTGSISATNLPPNFENFGFFHWQNCLRGNFGGSHLGDNLLAFQSTGTTFGYFGSCTKKTAGANTLILNSCSGTPWQWSYSYQPLYDRGLDAISNFKIHAAHRTPSFNELNIGDLTVWNPGQGNGGAEFGATNNIRLQFSVQHIGDYTFNVIDNTRNGFNKGVVLYGTENNESNLGAYLDGFTYYDGGISTAWFGFYSSDNQEAGGGTMDVTLPTGSDITTMPIRSNRGTHPYMPANNVVRDSNHVWAFQNAAYVTLDTTEFDTGNSSKKFFLGSKNGYSTEDCKPQLFGFTKQASNPTSVTIRYKVDLNGHGNPTIRLQNILGATYQLTNNTSLTSTTWANTTLTWKTGRDALPFENAPVGAWIPLAALFSGNDNQIVWIDSITVNY